MSGLLIKGGLVPFHAWLPGAYGAAPAGVSVFLGGIVTKTTGIFTLIRFFYSITGFNENIKTVLLITGSLSIVIGALWALKALSPPVGRLIRCCSKGMLSVDRV